MPARDELLDGRAQRQEADAPAKPNGAHVNAWIVGQGQSTLP
jgi:hypothetical protein